MCSPKQQRNIDMEYIFNKVSTYYRESDPVKGFRSNVNLHRPSLYK